MGVQNLPGGRSPSTWSLPSLPPPHSIVPDPEAGRGGAPPQPLLQSHPGPWAASSSSWVRAPGGDVRAGRGPHLGEEVDFEARGLVGPGLSVVEIVAHGQHELWGGRWAVGGQVHPTPSPGPSWAPQGQRGRSGGRQGVRADLQDLGELPAVSELQRGLAQALQAGPDLLRPLLQGGLEVEAAQAGFVFRNRQHLPRRPGRSHPSASTARRPPPPPSRPGVPAAARPGVPLGN